MTAFTASEVHDRAIAEATAALETFGEDPTLSIDAIERYARACADAAILRHRWDRRGRPMLGVGSRGQVAEHAMFKALRDADEFAAKMGERLLLTPASRNRRTIGRPPGASQSPDHRPRLQRTG